jgi:hypothetical protein
MTRQLALILLVSAATGCQALEHIHTIQDVANGEDLAEAFLDELEEQIRIDFAGLSPSPDYRANGAVDLNMVARGAQVSLSEVDVQVKNRDSSYSSCDHADGEVVGAAPLNALTLLIDGSGSMEVTYPDGECDTCPHDPGRERVGAAHRFIDTLYDVNPESLLAVAEFGPDPTLGMRKTAVHSDFDDDRRRLWTALDSIGGDQPIGTPLYDSLYEMIEATEAEADHAGRYGERVQKHVVVLSDGQDNSSDYHDLDGAIAAAVAHDVVIYIVGLGPASAADMRFDDSNMAIRDLQTLAHATGGFYAGVDDPVGLHELFDSVAYALAGGYERHTYNCLPGDTADSTYRVAPPTGTRVEGRLVVVKSEEIRSEWAFIAP